MNKKLKTEKLKHLKTELALLSKKLEQIRTLYIKHIGKIEYIKTKIKELKESK